MLVVPSPQTRTAESLVRRVLETVWRKLGRRGFPQRAYPFGGLTYPAQKVL